MQHNIFLIHPSVMGHLDCFQSLAIVSSAAINLGAAVSLLYPCLHSSGYMPRSGIARLYENSIFSFLRKLHTVFQSSCTNLHFHKHWISVPFSPTSSPEFDFVCIIDDSHSDWGEA
jgi:hypothetical protein